MAANADLSTTCFTCAPLQKYVDLSGTFADKLSSTLHDPILILFTSLAGLWVVASGIKLSLKHTNYDEIIKDFIYISITAILLGSNSTQLISYVFTTALSIMGGASQAVFSIAGNTIKSSGYSGLVSLAANGEQAVYKVFQAAKAISHAGSAFNIANYVYALVLVIPYFLLVVVFASQVVVAIFRAMMVGVFAPFLFMAFAFNWGRGMSMTGAKTLLASILVLFACTAALSLTIYGVNNGVNLDPSNLHGDALNQFASLSNPDFLVILFLGWMGTALTTEGTSIANSIAGTALTNAAAGIMTTGIAGSAMALGQKAKGILGTANPLTMGGRYQGAVDWVSRQREGWGTIQDHTQSLVDKFKNINKPDGGN